LAGLRLAKIGGSLETVRVQGLRLRVYGGTCARAAVSSGYALTPLNALKSIKVAAEVWDSGLQA